ncbi:hypothetical protein DID80_06700 [Candidatus Marinamargulisbacteria bacterium SCGC AAA071-K20]|nr:hypothetical protein DID80_06700 [Candidatus Marinamargulisbacteria bacterium SCGC AAA071-K20]
MFAIRACAQVIKPYRVVPRGSAIQGVEKTGLLSGRVLPIRMPPSMARGIATCSTLGHSHIRKSEDLGPTTKRYISALRGSADPTGTKSRVEKLMSNSIDAGIRSALQSGNTGFPFYHMTSDPEKIRNITRTFVETALDEKKIAGYDYDIGLHPNDVAIFTTDQETGLPRSFCVVTHRNGHELSIDTTPARLSLTNTNYPLRADGLTKDVVVPHEDLFKHEGLKYAAEASRFLIRSTTEPGQEAKREVALNDMLVMWIALAHQLASSSVGCIALTEKGSKMETLINRMGFSTEPYPYCPRLEYDGYGRPDPETGVISNIQWEVRLMTPKQIKDMSLFFSSTEAKTFKAKYPGAVKIIDSLISEDGTIC